MKHTTTAFYHIIVILAIVAFLPVQSAASNWYFKQISLSDGLSQSTVKSILHDANGFMWFGTKVGLNKYDHQSVTSYYHIPSNPTSLPDNEVLFVMKDKHNDIWVGCNAGLARYNAKTDNFNTLKIAGKAIEAGAYCLVDDGILFGGKSKIYKYTYATGVTQQLPSDGNFSGHSIFMGKWSNGKFILATRQNGLWTYDARTDKITHFRACSETDIQAAFIDSRLNLWVSPYGKGLQCYDKLGRLAYTANTANSAITDNLILSINQLDNKLWIGTDGGGINILDLNDKSFTSLINNPTLHNSFPEKSVLSIYRDDESNIWVGTVRGGAFFVRSTNMQTFTSVVPGSPYGMSMRTVNYLFQDKHGSIWIGTDGGGINRYNPSTNEFTHYPTTAGIKVSSIAQYDDHRLIFNSFSSGLHLFDTSTGQVSPFTVLNESTEARSPRKGISTNIMNIGNGKIMFTSDDVFIYDTSNNSLKKIDIGDRNKLWGSVYCFYSDERRALLFGNNFIVGHNFTSGKSPCIVRLNKNYSITAAQYDGKDNIYIGTDTKLFRYEISTRRVFELNAHLFKGLRSLILDGDHLWIGACNTVFLRQLSSGKTRIYSQSDGVEINEFIFKAYLVSPNKDIYAGGVNGLLKIDAAATDIIQDSTADIHFSLADVTIDGVSLFSKIEDNYISIPSSHSSINIKIIDKEKDVFRKKLFRFYINGTSDGRYIETYDRSISLHMLSPGAYNISVSCSTKDGDWTPAEMVVRLQVLAPWYKTAWFFIGLFILGVAIAVLVFRYSYYRKKELMLLQMKEHQRQSIENKVNFLININHELRTPLTLIYSPLKRLLLQPSNQQGSIDKETAKQLTSIYRQAKKMRNIINMILDMRRLESGHTKVRYSQDDINSWVDGIVADFNAECEAKSIELNVNLDEKIGEISFDKDKCEIILSNLIMNALKYTPENSVISVSTQSIDGFARIAVADCGIGLNEKDLQNIFGMFYQGENALYGSGIGLAYSKSLVELQNGRMGAFNNENATGATFWFELPLLLTDDTVSKPIQKDIIDTLTLSDFNPEVPIDNFSTAEFTAIVIEDDVELCDSIADDIAPYFKEVLKAYNGKDGATRIRHHLPDIIISDVMLPLMNGFELCRTLKSSPTFQHIPIILLSAQTVKDAVDTSYKLGADYYIPKPFEIEELLAICRNLLLNRSLIKGKYRDNQGIRAAVAESTISNADESFLQQIDDIINKNIENPDFNVNDIIDALHMSRSAVYNKLKGLTKHSLCDYVNQYKLKLAKELLADGSLTINAISFELGFRSSRYFSTFFKHLSGCTPSEYRSQLPTKK